MAQVKRRILTDAIISLDFVSKRKGDTDSIGGQGCAVEVGLEVVRNAGQIQGLVNRAAFVRHAVESY